jgi:AraC-like DNA-binding protein
MYILKKKVSKTFLRILEYVTIAMLLIVIFFSNVLYSNFQKTGLDITYDYNKKILSQLSYNIGYVNEVVRNFCITQFFNTDIRQLMVSKQVSDFDTQKLINRFNNVVMSNNYVHSSAVYNSYLKRFFSTVRGISYNDKEVIDIITNNMSMPYLNPVPRILPAEDIYRETEVFTYFMYESGGKSGIPDGVFVVNINTDWLSQTLEEIKSPNSNIIIINPQGNVICDASSSYKMHDTLNAGYLNTVLEEKNVGRSMIEYVNGEKKVITYSPIPNTQWILINEEPYEIVFKHIDIIKKKTVILSLIFALISVIISIFITLRVYTPFNKLVRNVKEKLSKNMSIEYPGDDVEYLSSAFNLSATKFDDYEALKKSTEEILKDNIIKSMLLENSFTLNDFLKNSFSHLSQVFKPESELKVILLKIDGYKKFLKMEKTDRKLLKFAICNISKEVMSSLCKNEVIDMGNDEIVIILDADSVSSTNHEEIGVKIKDIQSYLKKYYSISLSAFISEEIGHSGQLPVNYRKLQSISKYRILYGCECIIEPHEIENRRNKKSFSYPADMEKKLLEALKTNNTDMVKKQYNSFISAVTNADIDSFTSSVMRLAQSVSDLVEEINKLAIEKLEISFSTFYLGLVSVESLEEMDNLFMQLFTTICNHRKIKKDKKYNNLVESIKAYVEANYADKTLSLTIISSELKISSVYYLNRMFKEYSGRSISEYVNEIRLCKAADLLKNSNSSIRDIFDMVGYDNESNFYKLFKKQYGVTPNEFRLKYAITEFAPKEDYD